MFVFLMMVSIAVSWAMGLGMSGRHKKLCLTIGIVYNVSVLFVFKYLTFFTKQMGLLWNGGFPVIEITLPIGISFFTFQLISYLIDVYRASGVIAQRNPLYVGLYVSCFRN